MQLELSDEETRKPSLAAARQLRKEWETGLVPNKPSGLGGALDVRVVGDGTLERLTVTPTFRKISFPAAKNDLETLFMDSFLRCAKGASDVPFDFGKARKFENDHGPDFHLTYAGQPAYCELVEIVPLDKGGYTNAGREYDTRKFAEYVFELILEKDQIYRRTDRPIFLLMYVTDNKFVPSANVLKLARHYVQLHPGLIFAGIFFFGFVAENEGRIETIDPYPEDLRNLAPAQFKGLKFVNLDPERIEITKQQMPDETISVGVAFPPVSTISRAPGPPKRKKKPRR